MKYKIPSYIQCIEEAHNHRNEMRESRSDVNLEDLRFGKSFVYDYFKYGKSFKKKMRDYNKTLGLHLPKSKRQIKITDPNIEMLTRMKINNREVSRVPGRNQRVTADTVGGRIKKKKSESSDSKSPRDAR